MKLKEKYTTEYIKNNNLLLFETVVGSHAFGLNTETSDVDFAGVFFMELDDVLSNQIDNQNYNLTAESKAPDVTYHEISKFVKLLQKNDANALEILQSVINKKYTYLNEKFIDVDINNILSKKCLYSFGEYAVSQMQKAKAKNKKIMNPVDKEKKDILDFCYFLSDNAKSILLKHYLKRKYKKQLYCGVVNTPHAKDVYGLFYDKVSDSIFNKDYDELERKITKQHRKDNNLNMGYGFKGIVLDNDLSQSNEIRLSSIPHEDEYDVNDIVFLGYIYYNKDGYIQYCKDYKEYWEFVEKRNPVRYSKAEVIGYDQKDMSHCVRLLTVAKEIANGEGIKMIRTTDKDYLMDIKFGKIQYDILLETAMKLRSELDNHYKISDLSELPDGVYLNVWLIAQRNKYYAL